jgi:hypothetical protein
MSENQHKQQTCKLIGSGDVHFYLCEFLNAKELIQFSSTCSFFHQQYKSPEMNRVWRLQAIHTFGHTLTHHNTTAVHATNWKSVFQQTVECMNFSFKNTFEMEHPCSLWNKLLYVLSLCVHSTMFCNFLSCVGLLYLSVIIYECSQQDIFQSSQIWILNILWFGVNIHYALYFWMKYKQKSNKWIPHLPLMSEECYVFLVMLNLFCVCANTVIKNHTWGIILMAITCEISFFIHIMLNHPPNGPSLILMSCIAFVNVLVLFPGGDVRLAWCFLGAIIVFFVIVLVDESEKRNASCSFILLAWISVMFFLFQGYDNDMITCTLQIGAFTCSIISWIYDYRRIFQTHSFNQELVRKRIVHFFILAIWGFVFYLSIFQEERATNYLRQICILIITILFGHVNDYWWFSNMNLLTLTHYHSTHHIPSYEILTKTIVMHLHPKLRKKTFHSQTKYVLCKTCLDPITQISMKPRSKPKNLVRYRVCVECNLNICETCFQSKLDKKTQTTVCYECGILLCSKQCMENYQLKNTKLLSCSYAFCRIESVTLCSDGCLKKHINAHSFDNHLNGHVYEE